MHNTYTPEYAKVTHLTTWQEVVPFLRTDDIVAVRFREGEPGHIAKVWVSRDTPPRIMAGARFLRYADGRFNARVADVILHAASGRADDLEPLAASLKAGDVVRATFIHAGSSAVTLEDAVLTDEDGDALLVVEDEDGGNPEVYYLTFFGRSADNLRALEVIDPDEHKTMDLAFIITAHYPGGYPETAIMQSPDAAILAMSAYLRPFAPPGMTYGEIDDEAATCVEAVMESPGMWSPGMSMEVRWGEVRVSITHSRLAGE